jgi:hypothetical protein
MVMVLRDEATGIYIWSESLRLNLDNWFETQQRVIRRIATSLNVQLSAERLMRLAGEPDVSLDMHDRWLRGQNLMAKFDSESWQRAVTIFRDAIREKPTFSPCYSSLVQMNNIEHLVYPGVLPDPDKARMTLELAKTAARHRSRAWRHTYPACVAGRGAVPPRAAGYGAGRGPALSQRNTFVLGWIIRADRRGRDTSDAAGASHQHTFTVGNPARWFGWCRASCRGYRAISGAEADRVVADAFGMHLEFILFRNDRVDAVEDALVERRDRVGRARLTELFFGLGDYRLGRQLHQDGLLVGGDELDVLEAFGTVANTCALASCSLNSSTVVGIGYSLSSLR